MCCQVSGCTRSQVSALECRPMCARTHLVCSSALNCSEFPRCSNESDGARATRITRVYVECARSWILGSSVVALDHWLIAHDRRVRALEHTNRGQFSFFALFYPLNHIFMPMTYNTKKY